VVLPVGAKIEGPGTPSFGNVLSTAQQIVIGDMIDVQSGGLAQRSAAGQSEVTSRGRLI